MQTTFPLTNATLRDLSCIQPAARTSEHGKSQISRLCQHMKKVTKTNDMCDRVQGEWLVYMCDESLVTLETAFNSSGIICEYWNTVAQVTDGMGGKKYQNLAYVAKAALTLSHSNAIPERGFSMNNALLHKDQLTLGEKTIVAERIVKDRIRVFGSVTAVPINKDIIEAARKAGSEYMLHLEEKHKKEAVDLQQKIDIEKEKEKAKEIQQKKTSLLQQLQEEEKSEMEQMNELASAKELINESSIKMSAAVEGKNMQSVKVAQMMLKAGNEKLQEVSQKLDAVLV